MFEQVVDDTILQLIRILTERTTIPSEFYLADGTGLALQLGHRRSLDLDFFKPEPFRIEIFAGEVIHEGGLILSESRGTVHCLLEDTKLSLYHYPYPLLHPIIAYHGLKVASIMDIACMKIIAVSQRAMKKDFFDLFEILKQMDFSSVASCLLRKYQKGGINGYHILKSLVYFDDAEESPDPEGLTGSTWEEVKRFFLGHEEQFRAVLL